MKRRSFFKNASLTLAGTGLLGLPSIVEANRGSAHFAGKSAKNIIFLVSDGMSVGTLNMANLVSQRKLGKPTAWINLYEQQLVQRALMDTASANALVTDSAAASSSWGGGVRVNNGSLNISPDGKPNKPILQKFKDAGKAVGCVTSVPIAHATPAGFCITNKSRGSLDEISRQYLPLKFDVMLGGGKDNFQSATREDKEDLFGKFEKSGYTVLKNRNELLSAPSGKPLLGAFFESAIPYALDRTQDEQLQKDVPTLAEMTKEAIKHLSRNKNGFVLQVEGGKVDWAAHANDTGGLIYDQLAFDDAIQIAVDFALQDKNTLVIITTDHGNANPGLFADDNGFEKIFAFRHTNDWALNQFNKNTTIAAAREIFKFAQGLEFTDDEVKSLLSHYQQLNEEGIYNPRKLPFKDLALLQFKRTGIGWGSMNHSSDYVELAMLGPGSDLIKPLMKNTDLHYLMLKAAEVENRN